MPRVLGSGLRIDNLTDMSGEIIAERGLTKRSSDHYLSHNFSGIHTEYDSRTVKREIGRQSEEHGGGVCSVEHMHRLVHGQQRDGTLYTAMSLYHVQQTLLYEGAPVQLTLKITISGIVLASKPTHYM